MNKNCKKSSVFISLLVEYKLVPDLVPGLVTGLVPGLVPSLVPTVVLCVVPDLLLVQFWPILTYHSIFEDNST